MYIISLDTSFFCTCICFLSLSHIPLVIFYKVLLLFSTLVFHGKLQIIFKWKIWYLFYCAFFFVWKLTFTIVIVSANLTGSLICCCYCCFEDAMEVGNGSDFKAHIFTSSNEVSNLKLPFPSFGILVGWLWTFLVYYDISNLEGTTFSQNSFLALRIV